MELTLLGLLAQLEPDEPADHDLLPHLGRQLVQQPLDRLGVVLHVVLVRQDRLLVEGLELALDDLGDHVVRLAELAGLRLEDAPLVPELLGGDLLPRQVPGLGRARDVEGQILDQLRELVGVGYEVRFAVDLDQHADRVVEVDVRVDPALTGRAAGALGDGGEALGLEDLLGLVHVAVGLLQGALGVHHAGAGFVPELLHLLGIDLGHRHVVSTLGSVGVASAAGATSAAAPGSGSGAEAGASSAAGAGAATGSGSGSISGPVARVTRASRPAWVPSASASAISRVTSETERIASSLPGIT